jgi:hypothetical protein
MKVADGPLERAADSPLYRPMSRSRAEVEGANCPTPGGRVPGCGARSAALAAELRGSRDPGGRAASQGPCQRNRGAQGSSGSSACGFRPSGAELPESGVGSQTLDGGMSASRRKATPPVIHDLVGLHPVPRYRLTVWGLSPTELGPGRGAM